MRSKLLISIFSLIILINKAYAQMPTLGVWKNSDADAITKSLPPNNDWIVAGAQLGYKFVGNDDFSDGLLGSGRVQLQKLVFKNQPDQLGLPIIGNFSKITSQLQEKGSDKIIQEMMSTTEGVNLGLYPFYVLTKDEDKQLKFTTFGSAVYKLNTGKNIIDSTSTVYLNQGRFSLGLGLDIFAFENNTMPMSLSAELIMTTVSRRNLEKVTGVPTTKKRIQSLELTGILPLSNTTGLLGQVSFPEEASSFFRVGLIFVIGSTNNNSSDGGSGGNSGTGQTDPVEDTSGNKAKTIVKGKILKEGVPVPNTPLNITPYINGTIKLTDGKKSCEGEKQSSYDSNTSTNPNGEFTLTISNLVNNDLNGCLEVYVNSQSFFFPIKYELLKEENPEPIVLEDIKIQ